MGEGCGECGHTIPDEMGYGSFFYAGTLDELVLPKKHKDSDLEWKSFPPNVNICREDIVRLPREVLKESSAGIEGAIYGLQSSSNDVISFLFGSYRDHDAYLPLTNTFRFLSEEEAKTHFPKSVKRVRAERVAEGQSNKQKRRLLKVLDYIGNRLDINIKYFDPEWIPYFREELIQEPKDCYDDVALAFQALGGTFTVGQYPGLPHVHLEYRRPLGGPGDFLRAGIGTVIAEQTFGKAEGIKFLVDSGHYDGEATGIYRKSSAFRQLQAPTIWVYSKTKRNTEIDRFLGSVQEFTEVVSLDKLLHPLTKDVKDFLRRQLKKRR